MRGPTRHPNCAYRCARSRSRPRAASRRCRSTTPPACIRDPDVTIDVEKGLARTRIEWVKERGGVEQYQGRPIQPVDNGNVTGKHLARNFPNTPKPYRALDGKPVTQYEFAKAGVITKEMIYVATRENLGRKQQARARRSGACRRRAVRRRAAGVRHPGIRALGNRARPRHHPVQHQPRRTRADDHRPQLPHQDQRQHRQLRRHVLGRGGSREDGVGDPLGRRHGDGPLHRPQHPQHARMDPAQFAGADRHRADLSGAGEGRRRSGQARLGMLQGHADRAVRTGRRLFHHPRRRAARLRAAHRQSRHRHRLARRLDHGQVVPVAAQGIVPVRALRRDLRHHAQIRRVVLARATACAPARSPTPTTARNSPNWRRWAS